MANTVNANITISFQSAVSGGDGDGDGDGASAVLKLEVNAEDNNDKTSFKFGDTPIYRQYKSSNVTVDERVVSDDTAIITADGTGTENITDEVVTFSNSLTASTAYPIKTGTLAVTLKGGNIDGTFTKTGAQEITAAPSVATDYPVGVCLVSYKTDYTKWKLSGVTEPLSWPDDTAYPVIVFVFGSVS